MKNIKFWKFTTLLLLLCNIGLLVLIFMRPGHPPGHAGEGRNPLDDFIISELKLTKEQESKFFELKKAHRQAVNRLHDEGKKLRNEYFSMLKKGGAVDSVVALKSEAIANNQREIELVTFNHFSDLRKICTESQQENFDNIIMEVLHRMSPPPPPPPPPPGGPNPPPPPPAPSAPEN